MEAEEEGGGAGLNWQTACGAEAWGVG